MSDEHRTSKQLCRRYSWMECPDNAADRCSTCPKTKEPVSEERLRNTRAWAETRIAMLSGADVIVRAIDELLDRRAAHEPKPQPSNELCVHLREAAGFHALREPRTNSDDSLMAQAADEIDRLQRENAELRHDIERAVAANSTAVEPKTPASKEQECSICGDGMRLLWRCDRCEISRRAAIEPTAGHFNTLQAGVKPWLDACFGPEVAADRVERNHRFIEEALELVQSCGCTREHAHQIVDYVYGRPIGDPFQEVGGVMVTLAALCLANGLDMDEAGAKELQRVWFKIEQIRAKQAAKKKDSALPGGASEPPSEQLQQAHRACWAMAEDGWLMHGVEGMDETQQLLCDYTHKYPKDCTAVTKPEHQHTDECWEPDSGCDLGRNEKYVGVADETSAPPVLPHLDTCKLKHGGSSCTCGLL